VSRIRLSRAELPHEKWRPQIWHPRAQIALQGAHIELMRVKNIDRLAWQHWDIYNPGSGIRDPGSAIQNSRLAIRDRIGALPCTSLSPAQPGISAPLCLTRFCARDTRSRPS